MHLKNDGEIEIFDTKKGLPGFPNSNVRHILIDKDGRKWFSMWEGGVVCMDQTGKIVEKYSNELLASDCVTLTFIDKDGSKWFAHGGTYSTSYSITSAAEGITHLKNDGSIEIFNTKKGFPSGMIYCIAVDLDNTRWFGTDKGAIHLRGNGQIEIFDEKNGLPDPIIHHILIDKDGRKWFSTDKGLFRMEKDSKIVLVYPKK